MPEWKKGEKEGLEASMDWWWMGPGRAMLPGAAASPAALRWQRGLTGALTELGEEIRLQTVAAYRAWPRGPTLPSDSGVGYLNVRFAREASLAACLWLCTPGAPRGRTLVTYNARPAFALMGLRWRALGGCWLAIVADNPERRAERRLHDAAVRQATGVVFLSWNRYSTWKHGRALHLDGGVEGMVKCSGPQSTKAIMYCGALSKYGGVELLIAAFRHIRSSGAELWLCGHGGSGDVEEACRTDRRIFFFGKVDDERLRELSTRAAVFVNPRPPGFQASDDNFPSKVLEYMSYGKPIVSTWTRGLAPEYREILLITQENPREMATAIERALEMGPGDREILRAKTAGFVERRLWSAQARRLRDFVGELRRGVQ
jgi:glycosyltransferase involved in cell wall biosynthesis